MGEHVQTEVQYLRAAQLEVSGGCSLLQPGCIKTRTTSCCILINNLCVKLGFVYNIMYGRSMRRQVEFDAYSLLQKYLSRKRLVYIIIINQSLKIQL